MGVRAFRTTIGDGFIELPSDVKDEFAKPRAPVIVSVKGHSYRTRIAFYDGKYLIPLRKDRQHAAGLKPGERCKVTIASDTVPPEVIAPHDLKAALAKCAAARADWDALCFTHKRDYVRAILSAKRPEVRRRRVRKVIETLISREQVIG